MVNAEEQVRILGGRRIVPRQIGTTRSMQIKEVLIRDVIDYIEKSGPTDTLVTPTTMEEGYGHRDGSGWHSNLI